MRLKGAGAGAGSAVVSGRFPFMVTLRRALLVPYNYTMQHIIL